MKASAASRIGGAARLREVADAARVSVSTASRVLNGSTKPVDDALRERVTQAARRLSYTANLSARAMAGALTPQAVLLLDDLSDPYLARLAAGAQVAADENHLNLSIVTGGDDPARESRTVQALRAIRPCAILLALSRTRSTGSMLETALADLAASGTQVVSIGSGGPDSTIAVPNRVAAAALGGAIADRGYRSAVVLAGPSGLLMSDDRSDGFDDGFRAGGGTVTVVRASPTHAGAHRAAHDVVAGGLVSGTVVVAVTESMTLGAAVALQTAGRRIGLDVALAGFSDAPTPDESCSILTMVHLPVAQRGSSALRMALGQDPDQIPHTDFHLQVLDSTPAVSAAH